MRSYEFTIHRRLLKDGVPAKATNADDCVRFLLHNCFKPEESYREDVWMLLVGGCREIVGTYHLSMGGQSSSVFDVKLACKAAIDSLARGVVLAHNHPSGSPYPSSADKDITERLKKALMIFDISLLDHIVIGEKKYFSFVEEVARVIPC